MYSIMRGCSSAFLHATVGARFYSHGEKVVSLKATILVNLKRAQCEPITSDKRKQYLANAVGEWCGSCWGSDMRKGSSALQLHNMLLEIKSDYSKSGGDEAKRHKVLSEFSQKVDKLLCSEIYLDKC